MMKKKDVEILEDIFDNTNKWLNFTETKNAALIAFSGASIFTILEIESSIEFSLIYSKYYIFLFVLFSSLVLISSFISFVPQTKMFWLWKEKKLIHEPNLFFYGDLAYLEPKEFNDGDAHAKLRFYWHQSFNAKEFKQIILCITTRKPGKFHIIHCMFNLYEGSL